MIFHEGVSILIGIFKEYKDLDKDTLNNNPILQRLIYSGFTRMEEIFGYIIFGLIKKKSEFTVKNKSYYGYVRFILNLLYMCIWLLLVSPKFIYLSCHCIQHQINVFLNVNLFEVRPY